MNQMGSSLPVFALGALLALVAPSLSAQARVVEAAVILPAAPAEIASAGDDVAAVCTDDWECQDVCGESGGVCEMGMCYCGQ